jgi:hypothetical protein
MKLALGLYGLFLLLVALNGNAAKLATALKADMPHFLPWLIVAGVIGALYDQPDTHDFALAFGMLVIFAFTLSQYSTLEAQAKSIYTTFTATTPATATATTATTSQLVAP